MKMRRVAAVVIGALVIVAAGPTAGELSQDDMRLLGLMYRNRFVPAAQAADG